MKKIVDLDAWYFLHIEETEDLCEDYDYDRGRKVSLDLVDDWLNAQPDAEEKRGKWIDLAEGDYKCSSCNEIFTIGEDCHPIYDCGLYYCPNCGAKMDLGDVTDNNDGKMDLGEEK